jgi:outer membrane lipoprotein-sorting protein
VSLLPATALAQLPSGLELAKQAEAKSRGFGGLRADAELTTTDETGEKRTAKLVQLWLERPNGALFSLIRFSEPKELAGTGLLSREAGDGSSERWLYLAGTKALKHISADTYSSSFIGTEFTYEDLSYAVIDRYSYQTMGEDSVEGRPSYKVKRTPRFEGSAYDHALVWFDKETQLPIKTEFYAPSGELLKVAVVKEYVDAGGRKHAALVEMRSARAKRVSVFRASGYKSGLKLSEKIFSVDQLNR